MITQAAIDLIKRWESFVPTPYDDRGALAIGYGHTSKIGPPYVTSGMKWTEAEATEVLKSDLLELAYRISPPILVNVTDNQLGAVLSLVYNIGLTNFMRSTVRKRINAGDKHGAANAFLMWNKSTNPKTGKREVLKGLERRRAAERELFLKP